MQSKVIGIIPARQNSTRLANKMLVDINGRPLIQHTIQQVLQADKLDQVVVATDSDEIMAVVTDSGAQAIKTSAEHTTGSDRVAEAARHFANDDDIILNIQGDEPMIPPEAINHTAQLLLEDNQAVMSTVATPLREQHELDTPGIVKVVLDRYHNALYFSRSPLPFARSTYDNYLKHIGLYGYRYQFLQTYIDLEQTPLELAEKLEQLRALENGYKIKVGIGEYERTEVNTPEELELVRQQLQRDQTA